MKTNISQRQLGIFRESRAGLARLLATENIRVVYSKDAETASFNTKTRTLTLSVWQEFTAEMYDLMVCHEVGHALYTAVELRKLFPEKYHVGEKNIDSVMHSIWNIVEDARIERKMKSLYRGIPKIFAKGYKEFIDRDFFRIKDKNIDTLSFPDRINLHFKIGFLLSNSIFFAPGIETAVVERIEKSETNEEIVQISIEIFELLKKQQQNEQKLKGSEPQKDGESGENDEDNSSAESQKEDDSPTDGSINDIPIITTENLEQTLKDLIKNPLVNSQQNPPTGRNIINSFRVCNPVDSTGKPYYKNVMDSNLIANYMMRSTNFPKSNLDSILKRFDSISSVMVKEFQQKRKSEELKRIFEYKTGYLNSRKLHSYKYNSDIFVTNATTHTGKNYGLIFSVDFSISMSSLLVEVLLQLYIMMEFCRKTNLPFVVYGFTDTPQYKRGNNSNIKLDDLYQENTIFIELFNSETSYSIHKKFFKMLIHSLNNGTKIRETKPGPLATKMFALGGTPLISNTININREILNFGKKHKIEKLIYVPITDGGETDHITMNNIAIDITSPFIVDDVLSKEQYVFYNPSTKNIFQYIQEMMRQKYHVKIVGFFLSGNYRMGHEIHKNDSKNINTKLFVDFGNNRYSLIPGVIGYDALFAVNPEIFEYSFDKPSTLGSNTVNSKLDAISDHFVYRNKNLKMMAKKIIDNIV